MSPRTVKFKANYWSYEETPENELFIYIGGMTQRAKTVLVKVKGFAPSVYLELPKRVTWNRPKCIELFEFFQRRMQSEGPISFKMLEKEKLHYKETVYTLCLEFPTHQAIRNKFHKICANSKCLYIPGVGNFTGGEFLVHEQNIDPIIKFTAKQDIKLAGWIKVVESEDDEDDGLTEEERKFSTADIDLEANWTDVSPYEQEKMIVTPLKYCSFDIECYSKNHNSKLPDPDIPENIVFQIIMIFGCFGYSENKMKMILLTLYNPNDIDGVEVRRHKSEKKLLLDFSQLISSEDPDIFTGYNIMKFDWNYLVHRAKLLGIYPQFSKISRLIGQAAIKKTARWSSSAYGQQEFEYLDCHGRTNMDVLPEIERNFRLPTYSLKAVSEFFLQDSKEDISARQLFMSVQLTQEIGPLVENKVNIFHLKKIKRRIKEIFPIRQTHGVMKQLRRDLLNSTPDTIQELVKKAIWICGVYCKKDGILPIKLAEKLNLRTTMDELANVMNVPSTYMHTRGQQIKVIAQLYRETMANDMIIPYKAYSDVIEKYQGAVVFKAVPGDYENVACLDFASLYPSIMIAYNISYDTILRDDDPTPDSECHVIDFEDHIGCLVRNTPISLSNRAELIENLDSTSGDVSVYARDTTTSDNTRVSLYKQTDHFNQGVKECVALTFEDGTVLKCTPDHRILTSDGKWVEAQDLEIGGNVTMTYRPPVYDIPKDYEFNFNGCKYSTPSKIIKLMQLFGLLCSDCAMIKGRTEVYAGHKLDIESITSDIKELSGQTPTLTKCNYGWSIRVLGDFGKSFRETPGVIMDTKAKGRSLPNFLFEEGCPKGVIAAFLSGLFGGDGHTLSFSKSAKALSSVGFSWTETQETSLVPIFDNISKLLQRLGFNPTVKVYKSRMERKLHLPINETLNFHEMINFAHCVHKSIRLEAGCLYLRHRETVWKQQKRIVKNIRDSRSKFLNEKKRYNMSNLIDQAVSKEKYIFNDYYGNPSVSSMSQLLYKKTKPIKPMFSRKHFPGPMEYMEKIGARDLFCNDDKSAKYSVDFESDSLPTFSVPLVHRESCGLLQTYDIEVKDSHSFVANGVVVHNCEHDVQKRKRKKEDILCKHHRYRFRRMKIVIHKDGTMEYQNEGIMPRLERRLLTERKIVKKEMFKAQARLAMHEGNAEEEELKYYKSQGWEMIDQGSLPEKDVEVLKVCIAVLDAKQKALKISSNSMYGAMGAQKGYVPLVPGAASITAMGRKLIMVAIERIQKEYKCAKLVYGDTDSCMMMYENKTRIEAFDLAKKSSKLATHYIKCQIVGVEEDYCLTLRDTKESIRLDKIIKDKHFDKLSKKDKIKFLEYQLTPIDLEFENMYGRFFLLTKKRYIAYVMNIDGKITNTVKKGVVLARRDNCEYLRSTYKKVAMGILDKMSESEVMNIIYDRVHALFTRQIPDTQLIIYMGVKKIVDYAKSKEVKDIKGKVLDKVYIDCYGDPIESMGNELDPLDPRLIYPNLPQVLLTLKMLERGDDVPANTRLEFLYLQTENAAHQGDKAEDYTYYKENKDIENLRPDNLHYLEKQLSKPITELLEVKYPREPIAYEKLDDARLRCIREIDDELIAQRIARTRTFVKQRPIPDKNKDVCIGWEALFPSSKEPWSAKKKNKWVDDEGTTHTIKNKLKSQKLIDWEKVRQRFIRNEKKQISEILLRWHGTPTTFPEYFTNYKFKGNMAKVEYILQSARTPGKIEVNPDKYSELINVCKKWKSRMILNELYKNFGLRIRPTKHPSRSGEELPILYPVMLTREVEEYAKGTLCQVYATYVKETRTTKKSTIVIRCDYDVLMEDGKVVRGLLRSDITTYLYRDSAIMKDILDARTYYNDVIKTLNEKIKTPFILFNDIDTVTDTTYMSD